MLIPSTPAAPLLAATRFQAASKVRGAATLSIRLYHRPPWTPLSRAVNIRLVQMDASTQDHCDGAWVSPSGLAMLGTGEGAMSWCCISLNLPSPPSYPPSLGTGLLPVLFRRSSHVPVGVCWCSRFAAWFPGGATLSSPERVPSAACGTMRALTPGRCHFTSQVSLRPTPDRLLVPSPTTACPQAIAFPATAA